VDRTCVHPLGFTPEVWRDKIKNPTMVGFFILFLDGFEKIMI
jgi:hypothetical protein